MRLSISRCWCSLALAGVLTLAGVGCGNKMYPVAGKVTLDDGTPVKNALVVFERADRERPISARASTQGDGSFQLSTSNPSDGVPPGKYRVLVTLPHEDADAPIKHVFEPRFSDFKTSGLQFEVKAGTNDFTIQLAKYKKSK